ncbi:hypothetical protein [Streptomyces sp. NPDC060031]|uniref:hypothetical protein n=1 Tax=Streptomyces sp. NPDC060031 TaxID=3347043 RepID=UPI0036B02A8F
MQVRGSSSSWNDVGPDQGGDCPPLPADPLGGFLHGLLTCDNLWASGGLRVTDTSSGVSFVPGCCDGLEDWRDWHQFFDGDSALWFGHDPRSSVAERVGDAIRLTVDAEQSDNRVIELSVTELHHLLADAEGDLAGFLALAAAWVSKHLPDHSAPLSTALARVLDLPESAVPPKSQDSPSR